MEEIPYYKLPLGFRFRPTDEQLIDHYLKRKTNGTILPLESWVIPEIDVCSTEPWDLPSKWRVKSSDLEWFFFAAVDRKYPSSNRSNRATKNGYWKATGQDRLIKSKKVLVGMKKTLVFHIGRAPRGTRSCWIMHEYRVVNPDGTDVVGEGAFVLGRLFKNDKDILNISPLSQASPNSDLSDEPRINPENIFGQLTKCNVADDEVLPYLVPSTMEPEQSHSNSGITTDVGSHQKLRIKQELLNSTNQLYRKMEELPYDKLPLGFRFRPTDEQLIDHYLKRKTNGTILPLESWVIPEIDVCSTEPWDLPSKWRVKSSDLEWFFFAAVDRKYPSSNRSKRATQNGYWKVTGKDRLIKSKTVLVGMKRTLVFHIGRGPSGTGSCWIMHEYRVVNPDGTDVVGDEGTFVLCRLFKKDKDILNITPLSQASPNSDLSDEPQINPENTSGQITEYNVANDEVLPYLIPTTMKPKQSHSNSDITTDVCTHQELRIIQEPQAKASNLSQTTATTTNIIPILLHRRRIQSSCEAKGRGGT